MKIKLKHFFADVANVTHFDDKDVQIKRIKNILKQHNIKVLNAYAETFPNASHTYLFCLAESHLSIHEFPEIGMVFLDIFTCSTNALTKEALKEVIEQGYGIITYTIKEIKRATS